MTLEFAATAASTSGIYCSEAYIQPGGKKTSTGISAKVTVGSTTETLCQGPVTTIDRSVEPDLVFGDTATTYTYTITIVNEGTEVLNISNLNDIIDTGLSYEPLSVSSSPASMGTLGEPATNQNQGTVKWNFPGAGKQLPTSTTWTIEYEVTGTLAKGQYASESEITFASSQAPAETTWPTALITVIDVYRIVVTNGDVTYNCDVWIGTDSEGGNFYIIEDCVIA